MMNNKIKKWLEKKGLSKKDVKIKSIEYYPNGKVKMQTMYVGDWDGIDCVQLHFLDYDEDGNLMEFQSKDDRLDWLTEVHTELYNENGDGFMFPSKKPSKKTGKIYTSKKHLDIIEQLKVYWDDNLPLTHLTRKEWFYKIADEFKMSFDGIEKIKRKYRPSSFSPSR